MKKYSRYGSVLILLLLWYIIAIQMNNEFRMPNPIDVFLRMGEQLALPDFYSAVGVTLLRSLGGLLIAFLLALILSISSFYNHVMKEILSPIILLTKSIPNISYIIIVLIWFGREISAFIITFLILFPMFYASFLHGFASIDHKLEKVMALYKASRWQEIKQVRLPMLRPYMKGSLSSGVGLAFKVGVMSEILGQVNYGIGRELQYCRTGLDMIGIFAWTGWIILLLIILDYVLIKLFERGDYRRLS